MKDRETKGEISAIIMKMCRGKIKKREREREKGMMFDIFIRIFVDSCSGDLYTIFTEATAASKSIEAFLTHGHTCLYFQVDIWSKSCYVYDSGSKQISSNRVSNVSICIYIYVYVLSICIYTVYIYTYIYTTIECR